MEINFKIIYSQDFNRIGQEFTINAESGFVESKIESLINFDEVVEF